MTRGSALVQHAARQSAHHARLGRPPRNEGIVGQTDDDAARAVRELVHRTQTVRSVVSCAGPQLQKTNASPYPLSAARMLRHRATTVRPRGEPQRRSPRYRLASDSLYASGQAADHRMTPRRCSEWSSDTVLPVTSTNHSGRGSSIELPQP